jgi:hypothetical protein
MYEKNTFIRKPGVKGIQENYLQLYKNTDGFLYRIETDLKKTCQILLERKTAMIMKKEIVLIEKILWRFDKSQRNPI